MLGLCPHIGRKFRFRAGFAAWQYRNGWAISTTSPRADAENHGIVTVADLGRVSEFLIVGCQHGWLWAIGKIAGIRVGRDSHGK